MIEKLKIRCMMIRNNIVDVDADVGPRPTIKCREHLEKFTKLRKRYEIERLHVAATI